MLSQRSDYSNGSCNNEDIILIKLEFLIVYVIEGLCLKERKEIFWQIFTIVTKLVSKNS